MLTDPEIDSIVADMVAKIKPYMVQGELVRGGKGRWGLNSGDGKHPWPEFWPGYNASVKERDTLRVHIESGVFPDHLIRARSPNQTDKEFEYAKATFKQVTLPVYLDYENTIKRALHRSNWQVHFDDEGGDLETYITDEVGETGSLIKWFEDIIPRMQALDAMGVLCIMPREIPTVDGTADDGAPIKVMDPDTLVSPEPLYFPCSDVWGYAPGKWFLLLTTEKSMVTKGGKEVKEGMVLWLIDDDACWRVAQAGKAHELRFEVTLRFEHAQGYPPCMHLMGVPKLESDRIRWQSHYLPAKDLLDLVLMDSSYLNMAKANSAYPYRVMIGHECEYREEATGHTCVGGTLMGYKENGGDMESTAIGKCPSCNGTGVAARLGPNGVLFVKEKGVRDDGQQTKAQDAMTFVEPAANTLQLLREEINTNTDHARRMLHIHSEAPIAGGEAETATAVGVGVKAQQAFIAPIAGQVFTLIDFALDCIARQRFGFDDSPYTVVPATQFDLRTEADYIADLKEAQAAGLPPSIVEEILLGYVHMRYGSDPFAKEAFDAIALADRLITVNWQQLIAMEAKGIVKPWEIALHNEAMSLYQVLSREKGFMDLDVFEKAERLKAKARELYEVKESEQPEGAENPATGLAIKLSTSPEEQSNQPQSAPQDGSVQDTALNGAQINSLVEIITQVSIGVITRETAKPLIMASFPAIGEEDVNAMLSGTKKVSEVRLKQAATVAK